MLGFSVSELLASVEQTLNDVSAPMLQASQQAFQLTREKYPHLSMLGTVALLFVVGYSVYRNHKQNAILKTTRKQEKDEVIQKGFEDLSEVALKQALLFEQHVNLVKNIRQKLDGSSDDDSDHEQEVPVEMLNMAKRTPAQSLKNSTDQPRQRAVNQLKG